MRFTSLSPLFVAPLCLALLTACGDDTDDNNVDDDEATARIVNCAVVPDGTPCGSPAESACDAPDTCSGGQCQHNYAAAGTACGDASSGACDAGDTCNGAGSCLPNHFPDGTACGEIVDTVCNPLDACVAGICETRYASAGTACGSATQTECDAADTCDGAGSCLINLATDGTLCGDPTNTLCNPSDTCFAGACQEHLSALGEACGDATVTACDLADTCDAAGDCVPNHVDAGTPCGDATSTDCDLPDTCDGAGACGVNYVAAGTPCGATTDTTCDPRDVCDAGTCVANVTADGTLCYDCAAGAGSCSVCTTASCVDRPQLVCQASGLTTTSAAGNNHRGNIFDLIAKQDVIIRSFDASPMGNTTIEIYTRPGSYSGFAADPAGWTFLGSAATSYTGGFSPVAVPVNVTIRAGETQAFYVTSNTSAVSLDYSNGSSVGAVFAEDANLQFMEGVGLEYPFTQGTGALYAPRVWNGVIHYDLPDQLNTAGTPYVDTVAQGAMFDIDGIAKADIGAIFVELAAGTHDVDVYFRRGTFVGHEASSAGWELIGSVAAVNSLGGGALTRIGFADRVELNAAETVGFYVDTKMPAQLRTNEVGAVGDVADSTGAATLRVGVRVDSTFTTGTVPAAIRAVVETTPCVTP